MAFRSAGRRTEGSRTDGRNGGFARMAARGVEGRRSEGRGAGRTGDSRRSAGRSEDRRGGYGGTLDRGSGSAEGRKRFDRADQRTGTVGRGGPRRGEARGKDVRFASDRGRVDVRDERRSEDFVPDDFVSGRHPVLEALKAGRPINKILVADTSEGGSLVEILGKAKAAGVVVQKVPKANLVRVAGEHHQGVVALISPKEYVELDEIIAKKTGQPPLVLLLDEVADPHNLGAILRSAEATGAQGVVIPKRRAVPLTGVVAKAAAGALEYVPVARVTNLVSAMDTLKKAGYWIIGTALESGKSYTEVDYKGPVAIVIGAEGQGLSRLVKERCDFLVQMPMLGHLQSLNASVAAGVMLYEVVRQRV